MNRRSLALICVIVTLAIVRLAPHWPNVTPVGAMALLGGACFANRRLAYLVPLAAMLASDVVLAVVQYDVRTMLASQPIVYACIIATTMIGQRVTDRQSVLQVGTAALASSLLFYAVTNWAVWAFSGLYPHSMQGLSECYTAALPFFRNSLLGDAGFTTVLFGGLALVENRVASIRVKPTVAPL